MSWWVSTTDRSVRIKMRSATIVSVPYRRSGPVWHLIRGDTRPGFTWPFHWLKNGLPEAPLFAKIEVVGGQGAELDHFDLAGGARDIVMEYQCSVLHVKGVPEIILDLRIAQEFEQTIAFGAQYRKAHLANEFWTYLDIIPFRIVENILVFEEYTASAFCIGPLIHRAGKTGKFGLDLILCIIWLDVVIHCAVQDIDINVGAFYFGL